MATKTNAMRFLDSKKIEYHVREYDAQKAISATEVAKFLGQEAEQIFKTLVTTDGNRNYFVFCIPGDHELDLKKAAKVAGMKKIEMLKQKELFPLTGYIHGGCSPLGMKKLFPTFINESAKEWQTIFVSAGKIGMQIEIEPQTLSALVNASFEDLIKD